MTCSSAWLDSIRCFFQFSSRQIQSIQKQARRIQSHPRFSRCRRMGRSTTSIHKPRFHLLDWQWVTTVSVESQTLTLQSRWSMGLVSLQQISQQSCHLQIQKNGTPNSLSSKSSHLHPIQSSASTGSSSWANQHILSTGQKGMLQVRLHISPQHRCH